MTVNPIKHDRQLDLGLDERGPIESVEEYQFEPIRGYPMLQWAGKRPFTSTQYYPAQLKETHGPEVDGWRNKIYWGDNLQVMSHLLKRYRGQVQLIYIDPPFDSKADYAKKITMRGKTVANDMSVFEEKQYTDIWTNDEYLQFMYERLILLRELMSDNSTIWLHCDSGRNSYLRAITDEIFSPNRFLNEVTWLRSSSGKTTSKAFPHDTDTLLFYSKSFEYTFNPVYQPLSQKTLAMYDKDDNDGRGKYRYYPLQKTSGPGPETTYDYVDNNGNVWPCPPKGWRMKFEKLKALENDGRLVFTGSSLQEKAYWNERESDGKIASNLWNDIPNLQGSNNEIVDYPTQKPKPLLERIIRACSNPGDLVFDAFMGSGTTQEVAMRLGRRFLGADINLGAVQITTKRLITAAAELRAKQPTLLPAADDAADGQPTTLFTGFEVYNVNNYDIFRNPVEAKELLLQALEVNPLQPGSLFDGEKDGRLVKIMPVNRIATRQDLNELITGFDLHTFDRRRDEAPGKPVEKITLVCMGHEPDLAAQLKREASPYLLDVEVVDILRDKQDLQFKRDSEARVVIRDGQLVIEAFYPMNLLGKLSLQKEYVEDWRELVDSIMIDWNFDGAILQPTMVDIPEKDALVQGSYPIPEDAGTIRVKITDLLSESLETEVYYG